jgi:hypothetical protein
LGVRGDWAWLNGYDLPLIVENPDGFRAIIGHFFRLWIIRATIRTEGPFDSQLRLRDCLSYIRSQSVLKISLSKPFIGSR